MSYKQTKKNENKKLFIPEDALKIFDLVNVLRRNEEMNVIFCFFEHKIFFFLDVSFKSLTITYTKIVCFKMINGME